MTPKKWRQNDVALTSVCRVVGQPIKVVISQGFTNDLYALKLFIFVK